MPYEIKLRNVEGYLFTYQKLLGRQKLEEFRQCIVIGGEKKVHKRRKYR